MKKSFGAKKSKYDKRTLQHPPLVKGVLLTVGGIAYQPQDIEDQHTVGICTAIDLTNQAGKKYGKKYSADFQYLIQKRFVDGNWEEGSSLFSAMKAGNKYGFLLAELFPIGEKDRIDTYANYITKLQAISDATILSLLSKCENKLAGYAQVGTDPQSIAQALVDEPTGIQCMYLVDNSWWTDVNGNVTYDPAKIDPVRPPKSIIDGHSIKATYFNFNISKWLLHANSWGVDWNLQGNGHVGYTPVEAWIPYFIAVPPNILPFQFKNIMQYGQTSNDIKELQKRLGVIQTGYYGDLTARAVLVFQVKNINLTWYEHYILRGTICGKKTLSALNSGV